MAAPQPNGISARRMLDQYEVVAEIASGGMGTVYRATQIGLGRPVALKVLRQHSSWDRDTSPSRGAGCPSGPTTSSISSTPS